MAVAPSKPTPGTVAMRRARSFEWNEASRSRSSCRMRPWTSIACSAKATTTFVARSGTSFRGLLLDRLDRYEAHGRSGDRLADRLRITGISLAPLPVGLDVGRLHQPHLVAETDQLSRPRMVSGARRHADETRRELAEERDHLSRSLRERRRTTPPVLPIE